jgi:hypothetical protein
MRLAAAAVSGRSGGPALSRGLARRGGKQDQYRHYFLASHRCAATSHSRPSIRLAAIRRFGVCLLPELVEHLNPMMGWELIDLEAALANAFRCARTMDRRRLPIIRAHSSVRMDSPPPNDRAVMNHRQLSRSRQGSVNGCYEGDNFLAGAGALVGISLVSVQELTGNLTCDSAESSIGFRSCEPNPFTFHLTGAPTMDRFANHG